MSKHLILVTGASGFVGTVLCKNLIKQGFAVRAAIRDSSVFNIANCEIVNIPNIETNFDWSDVLKGVYTVIHLAARVHVMRDKQLDPLEEFRKINVHATERLAKSSAENGVKRFIYLSSIKVNGEETFQNQKFSELSTPKPEDYYGISKHEAELSLTKISKETKLEVVIIRPPLIYGSGVKGNFAQMIKVLKTGIPLPFGTVNNLRSLIFIENLVDALILCAVHPLASGKVYLLSDGEDISTSKLLKGLSRYLDRDSRLFSFPTTLLILASTLIGRSDQIKRLLGSLQVDSNKIRDELGWIPPYKVEDGLKLTVKNISQ